MLARITPTDDQFRVLDQEQGAPVFLVRPSGETTHVAIPIDEARRMLDDYLRRELKVGFEQADAGQLEPWDIEATLQEAHRRHAARTDS